MSRTSIVGKFNRAISQLPLVGCTIVSVLSLALWGHSYVQGSRYLMISDSANATSATTKTLTLTSSLGGLQIAADRFAGKTLAETHFFRFDQYRRMPTIGYSPLRNPSYPAMRSAPEDSIPYALGMQAILINDRLDTVGRMRIGLTLPWWFVFIVFSSYPISRYVVAVIRRQQEDRTALGLCPRCGVPVNELITQCMGCDKHIAVLAEV